jgi:predicted HAD superfamily Cof-like phosphohydrolase
MAQPQSQGPDVFADCEAFTRLYQEKTGAATGPKLIDVNFITKMVQDELEELAEAKDEAEQVDALLDACYYILQHLATTGLNPRPIWKLIHDANLTKFEKGYRREDGKFMKPPDFVPPDDEIRLEIAKQRGTQAALTINSSNPR